MRMTSAKSSGADVFTVHVLNGDSRVEKRTVQVGIRNLVSTQVVAGLKEGETVVVGQYDAAADANKTSLARRARVR